MPEFNAKVAQRIEVAPGLIILRVAPDGWKLPTFSAGQFGVIGLPGSAQRYAFCEPEETQPDPDKWIVRAYSIASSSHASEYLEFYIQLVSSGSLTPRLFQLERGSPLWLSPKISGLFTMAEVPEEAHIVLISTGTGLAPYMSMLRTHLVCGGDRRFGVLHGARNSWDLGYQSELSTLQHLCHNFTYLPSISRPQNEITPWKGEVGHVQDLWKRRRLHDLWKFHITPENTHIFLCGNPSMIEDTVQLLTAEGFREHSRKSPGQIHVERYW
jgi:ferredoxin--NADP+ reductase